MHYLGSDVERAPVLSYQVTVLRPGYANWLSRSEERANGTITLIRGPHNAIVDTGSPMEKRLIVDCLQREGLDACVSTYQGQITVHQPSIYRNLASDGLKITVIVW